jgi:hypothetical protein
MNAKTKIRMALRDIMSDGEANACEIWKGYDMGTGLTGWHYKRFGHTATFAGDNLREALDFIAGVKSDRVSML